MPETGFGLSSVLVYHQSWHQSQEKEQFAAVLEGLKSETVELSLQRRQTRRCLLAAGLSGSLAPYPNRRCQAAQLERGIYLQPGRPSELTTGNREIGPGHTAHLLATQRTGCRVIEGYSPT